MRDEDKPKEQRINELKQFRQGITELEELDTPREQAEEALRPSEEKYRVLVENANEAVVVAQDGMLRFVNPKNVEIFHPVQHSCELLHENSRGYSIDCTQSKRLF